METYVKHNSKAWDAEVSRGNIWTVPVDSESVVKARQGKPEMYLTPTAAVPLHWLDDLADKDVLCLAGSGGQQGPLAAAMGAHVTVFDNSAAQLEQDRKVAAREELDIRTIQGDMRNLAIFPDESFDMIIHPVSNCFVDDVEAVWREAYRVLRHGGVLLAGVTNPVMYLFDEKAEARGKLKVKYTIPYSDMTSLSRKELDKKIKALDTMEFSHTLDAQLGGLCRAGFAIVGFYSDASRFELTDSFIHDCYLAIRAIKVSKDF
ncbi:Methyltransferase type 11 [Parasphaerochaeta coccoides DSM 17374]|uniref:Methyltransferase type 11 n=2 Tax=Parasphaerochaeta TaxID=3062336 RepID=F4GIG0_PARC1|nr:Methyltransferase type 11 [Parasphaerochaeta coccoides DSM 17374]